MTDQPKSKEEEWRLALTVGETVPRRFHHIAGFLPSNPRCKMCNAPFKGWGGLLMRMMGRRQSRKNPRYCEPCAFQEAGGAEVEISMLFADVRGSTTIAERMSPANFTKLISGFYEVATEVLVHNDALIDRLVGDEVIGLFIPAFAGQNHSRRAIHAAQELVQRLGSGKTALPIGVGVHTGNAFVGVVQGAEEGINDFTALGDNVNITARLASLAGAGEILVSDVSYRAAGLDFGDLERRSLMLKGKSEAIEVHVVKAESK
ncbi:MAG: adenylate/guanylate cyclase domain-containing protein [Anaerolineales bacterium]|nr:adenylate/guanylate cyclase domain-containing protein [Anaerolineae bacterium]PWB70653.1 MAG: adenylate/guanylate cyclase domain-containing protein [Anaerolineales bacterium]